ncbi:MAG TPA: YcfL family protein [Tepidisphaeraceae bacterium]|nr:YcfL family protein [Tepidisphaeraceae bacterium]
MRMAIFIGTISTAAILCGCETTSPPINSVENAQKSGQVTVVPDRRIITDSAISGIAEVLGVNETTVNGLKKIQVRVFNGSSAEGEFFYKFEWFDSTGMLVDTPTSIWRPQTIEANEEISLISISPNPNANDFRLKLQANE